jgi:nicotinate-nucleotide pyrophosphorylase (carboxylating)
MGGGFSHRSGLDDLILVKEDHIEAAGGLTNALPRLRDLVVPGHLVEVEVTGLDHAMAVAETGVSLLLLDNMQPQEMADVVVALTAQLGPGRAALEASGNIAKDTIAVVGATGVDYVSSGSLTHSTCDLDLSLLVRGQEGQESLNRLSGDARRGVEP